MARNLTKREWTVMNRKMKRTRARKLNPPARGLKTSLQDQNRPVIAAIEAKMREAAGQAA